MSTVKPVKAERPWDPAKVFGYQRCSANRGLGAWPCGYILHM